MIKKASIDDLPELKRVSEASLFHREADYWERCLDAQQKGHRDVYVVFRQDECAGFVIYNREPRYKPFARFGIPEIQDLFIAPDFRGLGLAKSAIGYCEDLARAEGWSDIGIGVGLNFNYGAAQNLYVRLGYVPDGQGVTYSRETVPAHGSVLNDDELSLMLIKSL